MRGLRRALLECEEQRAAEAQRHQQQQRLACRALALDMVAVVDVLEQAAAHPSKEAVAAVGRDMVARLRRHGVVKLPLAQQRGGAVFDPAIHNAVALAPSPAATTATEQEQERMVAVVTQVHKQGYTLHGALLRAADVTVAPAGAGAGAGAAPETSTKRNGAGMNS